jgi:signal transduction histidine kinase
MQVVGNLISNAAKFSRADGDVDIWLVADRGRARISVRDHGIGIPDGAKDQVFGRFTQIDSSEQRKFGGTGLGLNISREIIEVLGGTIDYESTLSVGTTFFIEVPCHEVDQADQISSSDWQRAIPAQ